MEAIRACTEALFYEALVRRRAAGHALTQTPTNGSYFFSEKEVRRLGQVVSKVGVHKFMKFLPDDGACEDCENLNI